MQRFESRPGSSVFVDNNNFCYYSNRIGGDAHYFTCASQNTCPARATLRGDLISITVLHNHAPDPQRVQKLQFRQELRHRAANELQPLRQIFDTMQVENPAGALAAGRFQGANQRMMERARANSFPPVPATLIQLHNTLTDVR